MNAVTSKAAAFVIWIGFAAWQIGGLVNVGTRRALFLSILGSMLVLAASGRQAFVVKRRAA